MFHLKEHSVIKLFKIDFLKYHSKSSLKLIILCDNWFETFELSKNFISKMAIILRFAISQFGIILWWCCILKRIRTEILPTFPTTFPLFDFNLFLFFFQGARISLTRSLVWFGWILIKYFDKRVSYSGSDLSLYSLGFGFGEIAIDSFCS